MKKYLFLAALLLTAFTAATTFTACSNDDIQIDHAVNVDVKLSTVVAPFAYNLSSESVKAMNPRYKVRARLLAYDANGAKVFEATQIKDNYDEIASASLNMPDGQYTLLAITDVVRMAAAGSTTIDREYWQLNDVDKLTSLTIEKLNFNPYKYSMIGIGSKQVTFNSTQQYVSLEPEPAGALICLDATNINAPITFANGSTVQGYALQANKYASYVKFNDRGKFEVVPATASPSLYMQFDKDGSSNTYQNYCFFLPSDDIAVSFIGITGTNSEGRTSGHTLATTTISAKAGEEYLLSIDCALCGDTPIALQTSKK